jgi:hypothetical protein
METLVLKEGEILIKVPLIFDIGINGTLVLSREKIHHKVSWSPHWFRHRWNLGLTCRVKHEGKDITGIRAERGDI